MPSPGHSLLPKGCLAILMTKSIPSVSCGPTNNHCKYSFTILFLHCLHWIYCVIHACTQPSYDKSGQYPITLFECLQFLLTKKFQQSCFLVTWWLKSHTNRYLDFFSANYFIRDLLGIGKKGYYHFLPEMLTDLVK